MSAAKPIQKPIRAPKVAELVANTIRKRILNGELQEGDCLPPEAQLMESFSISRPTLREAFRVLEAERLISVMQGSRTGARVHQPKIEGAARYASYVLRANKTTIADIYDARLAIEPYAVRMLAETKPKAAAKRLREEAMRLTALNHEGKQAELAAGLAEFHHILVELGGNQTLYFLVQLLEDIVKRHQVRHLELRTGQEAARRKRVETGIKSFQRLIDLIEQGNAEAAEAHWRKHIEKTNKVWTTDATMLAAIDDDE